MSLHERRSLRHDNYTYEYIITYHRERAILEALYRYIYVILYRCYREALKHASHQPPIYENLMPDHIYCEIPFSFITATTFASPAPAYAHPFVRLDLALAFSRRDDILSPFTRIGEYRSVPRPALYEIDQAQAIPPFRRHGHDSPVHIPLVVKVYAVAIARLSCHLVYKNTH